MQYQNWFLVTNCPNEVNLEELNQRFIEMMSDHHKYRDYEGMVNKLTYKVKKTPVDELLEEHNSRIDDYHSYMGDEELSPLSDSVE